MKTEILWCKSCNEYTLQRKCKKCNEPTLSPKPAKYSPEDKYGYYRRIAKKEKAQSL